MCRNEHIGGDSFCLPSGLWASHCAMTRVVQHRRNILHIRILKEVICMFTNFVILYTVASERATRFTAAQFPTEK